LPTPDDATQPEELRRRGAVPRRPGRRPDSLSVHALAGLLGEQPLQWANDAGDRHAVATTSGSVGWYGEVAVRIASKPEAALQGTVVDDASGFLLSNQYGSSYAGRRSGPCRRWFNLRRLVYSVGSSAVVGSGGCSG
jgi:hypothetical protein